MPMLNGKVAIVTGAGQGLGREEALALAREGARVVVNDLGTSLAGEGADRGPADAVVAEIRAAGGEAVANHADVSDWEAARGAIEQAYDTFGRLDIVVNNAGVLRDRMSFNMSEDEFDIVLRVHCKGHFAMTRHACVRWRELGKKSGNVYGRIIHTASEAGLFGSAGNTNYAMAKAAIAALAQGIAMEMGKYGVTSNFIAPRARTRMTESTGGDFGAPAGGFDAWNPAWPAQMVVFLASEAAAGINGQGFVVWGSEITLMKGWGPVGQIAKKDGGFRASEIGARLDDLFGDHPRRPG